jgi:hypothetical protein
MVKQFSSYLVCEGSSIVGQYMNILTPKARTSQMDSKKQNGSYVEMIFD